MTTGTNGCWQSQSSRRRLPGLKLHLVCTLLYLRTCQTSCRGSASGCPSRLAGESGGSGRDFFAGAAPVVGRDEDPSAGRVEVVVGVALAVRPGLRAGLKRACFLSAVTCLKRSHQISSWTFFPSATKQ